MIRQGFIRQMPVSIRAHLATQPVLWLPRNDVEDLKQGVVKIQVSESAKLVGLLEDLSRQLVS